MDGGHVCGGTYYTTNCKADNSLSIVKADCQDKPNCVLKADNGKFGDPCVGTKKYLEVSDIHRLMKFTFQHQQQLSCFIPRFHSKTCPSSTKGCCCFYARLAFSIFKGVLATLYIYIISKSFKLQQNYRNSYISAYYI